MNKKLITLGIPIVIAVAMIVSIAYTVNTIVIKGQRADEANQEAIQARIDLYNAERDLAAATGAAKSGVALPSLSDTLDAARAKVASEYP